MAEIWGDIIIIIIIIITGGKPGAAAPIALRFSHKRFKIQFVKMNYETMSDKQTNPWGRST